MSQFEKLLQRVRSLDNNIRFEELRKILESYGYTMRGPSSGSSHMTFRKAGKMPITIPTHAPIKKIQIQMVKDVVESEENEDEKSQ